jgi:hypothetical protein
MPNVGKPAARPWRLVVEVQAGRVRARVLHNRPEEAAAARRAAVEALRLTAEALARVLREAA